MKKILFWLADLFDIDLTVEKIVKVETVREKQVTLGGVVEGDVLVKGNLVVQGYLEVTGDVVCLKEKGKTRKPWDTLPTEFLLR
jgi:hypothetical protein